MKQWDVFFRNKIKRIFLEQKKIIDIGGGLRIDAKKNNRYDKNREWLISLAGAVDYKIMDVSPRYHPDIVGDIHRMPFADNSIDAVICIAVLEHVENPIKACEEIFRVLKPGGFAFVYVPFMYYYHAEKGYYKDYWRFTEDSIRLLFKDFSALELCPVRGALGTWIRNSPMGRYRFLESFFHLLDKFFGKLNSKQTSGYNIFLSK